MRICVLLRQKRWSNLWLELIYRRCRPSPIVTLAARVLNDHGNSVTTALKHPLLKEGGLLAPLVASLAQWHLVDDPEEGLGSNLTEALKATLREADGLKRALGQVGTGFQKKLPAV